MSAVNLIRYMFWPRRRTLGAIVRQMIEQVRMYGLLATCKRLCEHVDYSVRKKTTFARDMHKFCLFLTSVPSTDRGGDSGRYRCIYQAEQMKWLGLTSDIHKYGTVDLNKALDHFDLFVMHRVRHDDLLHEFITRARERGKPVLYDTDDLIFAPQITDHIPTLWQQEPLQAKIGRESIHRGHSTVALCDAAIVSTEPLAEWVRRLFPEKKVHVNRNTMGAELLERCKDTSQAKTQPPTLTYISGSKSHDVDFLECVPALTRLLAERPELRLLLVGHLELPEPLLPFDAQIDRHPFLPWRQVPEFLHRAWVNLAPLQVGNPFNECKSALKYFEAAAYAVPTVASEVPSFDQDIRDGDNGFLCKNVTEWYEKTERLLTDGDLRVKMGRSARSHVLDQYATKTRSTNLEAILREVFGAEEWAALKERCAASTAQEDRTRATAGDGGKSGERTGVIICLYSDDFMVELAVAAARQLRRRGVPAYLWAMDAPAETELAKHGETTCLPSNDKALPPEAAERVAAWWKTARPKVRRGETAPYDGLEFKPLAEFEWSIWDASRDARAREDIHRGCAIWAERFAAALDRLRPHTLVLWNGDRAWCQVGRVLAERRGIRVCYFERGQFPRSASCDLSGVNAASDLATPEGWARACPAGLTTEQEAAAGAFIEAYHANADSAWDQPEFADPERLRREHGIPAGAKVLLMPMQVRADANMVFHAPGISSNADAVRRVVDALGPGSDLFVVAKRHPKEPGRHARLVRTLGRRGALVEGGNIHAWLRMCHAVATINSSVGIEALTYRKPVILLGRALYGRKGFTHDTAGGADLPSALAAVESQPQLGELEWHEFRRFLSYLVEQYLFWATPERIQRSAERMAAMLAEGAARGDEVPPPEDPWPVLTCPLRPWQIPARIAWRLRRAYRSYNG